LTAHLCLALFILALLIKGILNALNSASVPHPKAKLVRITAGFIFLTIIYGGFVAGHKAGLIYNTYPLMGGDLVPCEWLDLSPLWHNFVMNPATVQWMHRLLALFSLIHVLLFYMKDRGFHAGLWLGLITVQFLLGILTLIYRVPVVLGVMHQGMGALLFSWTMVMIYTYGMLRLNDHEHSAP
ncbi:MAG: COX15/CtaA family protein, partial [Alphaproteobacteria bacterium]|nr:COX15/CtaA family protein [Alphaproteobacteria bacterium]